MTSASARLRIYHHPGCSKSRECLELLRARGLEPEVVLYLQAGLDRDELEDLIQRLGIEPHALLRAKEEAYAQASSHPGSSRQGVLDALIETPRLLERPIVVRGDRAVIARPPARALELL